MTLRLTPAEIVASAEASDDPGLLGKQSTWARVPLGDVARIVNGAPFSSASFNRDQRGLPLLRIRDVGQDAPETYFDGPFEDAHLVERGAVLIGMDGDFRVAEWRGPRSLLNQRVCRIEMHRGDVYDETFLRLILQGYLDSIWRATSSVTVKHLSSKTIEMIPLPLPPYSEQKRIVFALDDLLSRVDAGRASLASAAARSRKLEQSVVAEVVSASRTDTPARIGDIAAVFSGMTPLRSNNDYYDNGTVPWITSSQINQGVIMEAERFVTDKALFETSLRIVPAGSILVAMYGEGRTRGKTAELTFPATTNQACAAIVLHEHYWHYRRWIRIFLDSQYEANRRLASGGVQPNLSVGLIKSMSIPLPPAETLDGVVDAVADRQAELRRLRADVDNAHRGSARLRRSLLTEAFTGCLVPQDPKDEPASVLLDRIRAERVTQPKPRGTRKAAAQ